MTNIPPPDRRSSALSFDEFIAVVVAFAVIGTIFFVSLRQKDGRFSLKLAPSTKAAPASPTPTAGATPALSNQNPPTTARPEPTVLATATPQATLTTPRRLLPETAFGTLPLLATSPAAAKPKQAPVKNVNFSDVPQVFWAGPYIKALAERGVLSGYGNGTFRPNQVVTRAEFASQLQKAFDQKVVVPGQKYKDVPDQFWGSSAIQETTRSGFLRGYPGNEFRPDQKISKVEALVSLTNGLGLTAKGTSSQGLKYQDAKTIPKYATDIIAVATEYGLVVNYPNRQILNPNKPLTRAEAAALTYQGMVQAGKVPAISSEYVAQP